MSHRQQPSEGDLRFDLGEAQLSNAVSGDSDAPPASTLYDPSVLALSPELRAKVAAREARNQNAEEQDPGQSEPGDERSPFHIMSPVGNVQKKPFELNDEGMDATNGDVENGGDAELELCCCGMLPVYPSLLVINIINIVAGLIGIGVGSYQVQAGAKAIVGFGSADSLVISGAFMAAVAYIIVGLLLIICGSLGTFCSLSKWREPRWRGKWLEITYQCLLLLVAFICLVLFVVNAFALSMASKGTVYDNLKWSSTAQSEPSYSCQTEKRLGCAGYHVGQCRFDNNETSNSFCPGHFCLDFCKIATDDVNAQSLCIPCRESKESSVAEFIACKEHEKSNTNTQGCEIPLNDDLKRAYQRLLGVALLFFIWVAVTVIVSSYQLCCA